MRPVLILSVDTFNAGPAELVTLLPITSTIRAIPSHVAVRQPEGGLDAPSTILCDQVRTIARERLLRRRSMIAPSTLARVEEIVRILLGL